MRVELLDLSKSYLKNKNSVPVLKEINWIFESGSFVSIIGPSGVGKSTLLHVMGLLDQPSRGQILWDGQDLNLWSQNQTAYFRNQCIGFVFQFHHLLPELTAKENVMLPLWMRGERGGKVTEKALNKLEEVGLLPRQDHRPSELSGGEQQRVAIARALVGEPKLVLADEPTGNLDEETALHVFDLLKAYAKTKEATVIAVTHHTQLAQKAEKQMVLSKEGLFIATSAA